MGKTLYIFDFDDTLITSDARVMVNHEDRSCSFLSGVEFAVYEPQSGDEFDFTDFDIYPPAGKIIKPIFKRLQSIIQNDGLRNVAIVSARLAKIPIQQFLSNHGIPKNITIAAVGSMEKDAKGNFVKTLLHDGRHDHVHVFEDNAKNIKSIQKTCKMLNIKCTHTLIVPR